MSSMSSSLRSIIPTPREDAEFVEQDLSNYLCPVCHGILKDCVQLPCGHKLCDRDIDLLFEESAENGQCPVQDDDCFPFQRNEVLPDYGTRREVMKLKVYCKFKQYGCPEIFEWRQLESHCSACKFRQVECPNKNDGCEELISFKDIRDHVTNHCQYSPILCQYCNQPIIRHLIKEHHETFCQKIEIPCKFHCDISTLPREEMMRHYSECPRKPSKCPYASAGCPFEGKESEVKEHERQSIVEHMTLNQNYTKAMETQNQNIQHELQALKEEKVVWQTQIQEIKMDYDSLVKKFEGFKKESMDFQLRVVSTVEKVFSMEELLRNVPTKQTTDQMARELQSLKESQEAINKKVTDMDRRGWSGSGNGRSNADPSSIEALKKQITNLEKQTAIQDIRLAELDLRFQILETASYDGVLIWKIMDYARRKNDAVTGRTYSLFSQPFYTGRFGYKMCGRIYLNGDGMGKGSHLSLFFVVMKGEHDALMPWPFQQNIKMALLDQQDGQSSVTDSFRPDTSSSSFQKPTTDMNTAVGCPMFISHAKLETRKYLKEDTIFIKIIVDKSGLPHH